LESLAKRRERAKKIYSVLSRKFPDAHCTLDHKNAYQLLVATILAAQCTDERVNMVTPALFRKYGDAKALAAAGELELQEMIRSTGFFRNKAKSLLAMAASVAEKHSGQIPGTLDELVKLSGVGRKTANVILANCFAEQAIIVDTHCKRLSTRLGFTNQSDPDKIELDVQQAVPEDKWSMWSHLMVFHGRNVCMAKKPLCPQCPIEKLCPYEKKTKTEDLFGGKKS